MNLEEGFSYLNIKAWVFILTLEHIDWHFVLVLMQLSWTFDKEGMKLEWRWKCQPASDNKTTTAGILNFLMDANIRLSVILCLLVVFTMF